MGGYRNELGRIREILRQHPRGLTVKELSEVLGVTRNPVAKYLDVLFSLGHVEMRAVGPAKLYTLSHRIPISGMLDLSTDPILVLDSESRVVQLNQRLLELAGVQREELLGSRFSDSSLPFAADPWITESLEKGFAGEGSSGEWSFSFADRLCHFRVKLFPTSFDDGTPGVTLLLEDVTSEKEAQTALRESEFRYRKLMETAMDAIFLTNEETGIILDCNQQASELLGLPREDIIGMHNALVVLESYERSEQSVTHRKSMMKETAMKEDYFITRPDGKKAWVDVSTSKFQLQGTDVLLAIFHDVSWRRELEESLKESELGFRELATILPQTVFEVDLEGEYRFLERYGPGDRGFTQEDLVPATDVLERFPETDRDKILELVRRALEGEEPGALVTRGFRKDGSSFPALIFTRALLRLDEVLGVRAVVVDTTLMNRS